MLESFVAGDGLAHVETMDADDASGVTEKRFNLDKPLAQPRKSFIHFRGGGGEGTTSNQPIVL